MAKLGRDQTIKIHREKQLKERFSFYSFSNFSMVKGTGIFIFICLRKELDEVKVLCARRGFRAFALCSLFWFAWANGLSGELSWRRQPRVSNSRYKHHQLKIKRECACHVFKARGSCFVSNGSVKANKKKKNNRTPSRRNSWKLRGEFRQIFVILQTWS